MSNIRWAMLTKKTNGPKLRWLEYRLEDEGIPWRKEPGDTPILSVPFEKVEAAWEILEPVDEVPNEDSRWTLR